MALNNRLEGTTRRVSVATGGAEGRPGGCVGSPFARNASISGNGRYVAFESCFGNLTAGPGPGNPFNTGDTNGVVDVFVHDIKAGTTSRVSIATSGAEANGGSGTPALSADGRLVAFTSVATNLVPAANCPRDPPSRQVCEIVGPRLPGGQARTQVYVRDTVANVTRLGSATTQGTVANGTSDWPALSPDGRLLAFMSVADNLAPGTDDNGAGDCPNLTGSWSPSCPDVFLRDLSSGKVELVSYGLDGHSGKGPSGVLARASISGDNRYVAFNSGASNIVPRSSTAVYVRDRRLA